MKLHVTASLEHVSPTAWNQLAGNDPFLQHAFLHALHETGCATPDTGWAPQYLLLNIAIGGVLGGAVDDSIFPVTMEIEHVKVWQAP